MVAKELFPSPYNMDLIEPDSYKFFLTFLGKYKLKVVCLPILDPEFTKSDSVQGI